MSLLRHGHASLCASSPKPTPVAVDLLVLTKAEACVRSYLNKLQDHYYRSSLDDRICDSSFHNVANGLFVRVASEPSKVTSPSEAMCLERKNRHPLGADTCILLSISFSFEKTMQR